MSQYTPSPTYFRHTIRHMIALLLCAVLMMAAPGIGYADDEGDFEEGTFVEIEAVSDSAECPDREWHNEPIIQSDSEVIIELSPGGTHTVTTDEDGNFSLDRQKIADALVEKDLKARMNVPVCLWRYENRNTGDPGRTTRRETERECAEYGNNFTITLSFAGNGAYAGGRLTPAATAVLDTGISSGMDTGDPFLITPVVGNFIPDNKGTVDLTITNAACMNTDIDRDAFSNGDFDPGEACTHPTTPALRGTCENKETLFRLPSYTITMKVDGQPAWDGG